MVVLGSREQLCIHEEVSSLRGRAQTNACHSLCKKRQKRYCAHFPRVAGKYVRLMGDNAFFLTMVPRRNRLVGELVLCKILYLLIYIKGRNLARTSSDTDLLKVITCDAIYNNYYLFRNIR